MKRIHEVAKELGLSSKALIRFLRHIGFDASSPMAPVTPEMALACKEQFEKNKEDMKLRELERRKIRARVGGRSEREARLKREKQRAEKKLRETMAKIELGDRTKKYKKEVKVVPLASVAEKKVSLSELTSVRELASFLGTDPLELISRCLKLGLMVTINQRLDFDTAATIAGEYGYEAELAPTYKEEEMGEEGELRSPIVTVMGHVDHGKTTLLDYIRHTNIASQEVGAITQHIGAYKVKIGASSEERVASITFIDTPGHHAFTAMRTRGAKVTDIVVLVIAADEGAKPQTVEALNHARDAGVPIIVAINKIDLPGARPAEVEEQLLQYNLVTEKHGGETLCCYVSARTGEGVKELLETILLQAELLDLRASRDVDARGTIIETRLDKGKGPVATAIIQQGTLKIGNSLIAGSTSGKIRALYNEVGKPQLRAFPADPIQIVGFDEVPEVGTPFKVIKDTLLARELSRLRKEALRGELDRARRPPTLDTIQKELETGKLLSLKLIIKGDTAGSAEALADSLEHLNLPAEGGTKEIKVQVIHRGAGEINESDIVLAAASGGVIIGYNIGSNPSALKLSQEKKVEIREYKIIYDAIEEVKLALQGLLPPKYEEFEVGRAEVKQVFRIAGIGFVAGSHVVSGKIIHGENARVKRDKEIVYEGKIESLKRFKDPVKEASEGLECGIGFGESVKLQAGDIIEVYGIRELPKPAASGS